MSLPLSYLHTSSTGKSEQRREKTCTSLELDYLFYTLTERETYRKGEKIMRSARLNLLITLMLSLMVIAPTQIRASSNTFSLDCQSTAALIQSTGSTTCLENEMLSVTFGLQKVCAGSSIRADVFLVGEHREEAIMAGTCQNFSGQGQFVISTSSIKK